MDAGAAQVPEGPRHAQRRGTASPREGLLEANVVMPGMVTATSASSESTEHVPPHPAGKNTPTRQQWSGSVPADSLRQPSRTEGSRLQVLRNSPCARLISAELTGDSGRVPFARSGGPRRATPPGDDARTRTSTRRNDPRTRPLALERKSRPTRSCRGWSLPRQPRESRRRTCPRPSGEEHADSALGNDRTWAWVWAATFQIHPMPRSTLLQCRCLPHRWAGSRAVADRSAGLASDRTIPRLRRRW